jgi:hypothetical protein
MGELTDSINRAEAFGLLPITWGFGATIGYRYIALSFIASLALNRFLPGPCWAALYHAPTNASRKGGNFWKEYPYFLPCLVTASYVLLAFIITLFFREVSELFGPCCRLTLSHNDGKEAQVFSRSSQRRLR